MLALALSSKSLLTSPRAKLKMTKSISQVDKLRMQTKWSYEGKEAVVTCWLRVTLTEEEFCCWSWCGDEVIRCPWPPSCSLRRIALSTETRSSSGNVVGLTEAPVGQTNSAQYVQRFSSLLSSLLSVSRSVSLSVVDFLRCHRRQTHRHKRLGGWREEHHSIEKNAQRRATKQEQCVLPRSLIC